MSALPKRSYGYRVSAYNDSDTSAPSDVVSKTTPHSIAGAPANVTAVAVSDSQIEIVWQNTATNESGFDVQRADGSGGWIDLGTTAAGVTEYRDSGLTSATSYGYQVFAVNSAGDSPAGNGRRDDARRPGVERGCGSADAYGEPRARSPLLTWIARRWIRRRSSSSPSGEVGLS